jgi:hypothetical protein
MLTTMMRIGDVTLVCLALASGGMGGCSSHAAASPPVSDAGNIPPSAYGECDPSAAHDGAAFAYTATCATAASDGGAFATCAQWSESADGDWSPFLESCAADGGQVSTVPCPAAGVSGVCAYPAGCTTQTTVFFYGAAQAAAGKTTCATTAGASFTP